MEPHFLQSKSWETFLNSEGKKTFHLEGNGFSALASLETTPVGNYLYCPYGPFLEKKSALKTALKALENLAKSESAIFIRLEPTLPFSATEMAKYAKKSKDINPSDTWILDISQDQSAIISGFSQGTRTRFNQFAKKGISVEITKNPSDIKYLINLQKKLAKEKGFNTFSPAYLKAELEQPFASLYLVKYRPENEKSEKIIAASLFFDHNDTRYYMQSAADSDYKKLPGTVALLSTSIFDAKEKGLKFFDFWGIAPEGAKKSHPWYGFTSFKKSFGGEEVHYAGTWDIPIKKSKYLLYKTLRKVNLILRKLKS